MSGAAVSGHGSSAPMSVGEAGPWHPDEVKARRRRLREVGPKATADQVRKEREEAARQVAEDRWFVWGMGMWARFPDEDSADRAQRRMEEAFPGATFDTAELVRPGTHPGCVCCGPGGGRLHDGHLPWNDVEGGAA